MPIQPTQECCIPRVIADNNEPYVRSEDQDDVDAAVSAMLHNEIGQLGYDAKAALAKIELTSNLELILKAMDGIIDEEDGDITFKDIQQYVARKHGIQITAQEYMDASRFDFSM